MQTIKTDCCIRKFGNILVGKAFLSPALKLKYMFTKKWQCDIPMCNDLCSNTYSYSYSMH